MAEIHIIGQITSAKNFPEQNLFCKWTLQHGLNWKVIAGKQEGQTQAVTSIFSEDICKWSYPIDIHLAATGLPGWPKIFIQVFHLDWLGRCHLFGYGFLSIPSTSGLHSLQCYTWRPIGSLKERFIQHFLGGGPQLKYPDLICSSNDRFKLNTEAMGIITFDINVLLRNFSKFGVNYK